jgi:hypothetical protein
MEAIGSDPPGYRPVSLSWQKMFQQLKDYHDLGHSKGRIPPRMLRWMSMQQRQYRVYGIGLKEPVGIIKHRVRKLNELGFEWNPSLDSEPMSSEEHEQYLEELEAEEMARARNRDHNRGSSTKSKNRDAAKTKRRDTPAQNPPSNKRKIDKPAFKVKGITLHSSGKRWEVRAKVNGGARKYVGSFETHQEAVKFLAAHNKKQRAKAIAARRPSERKTWHVHLNLVGGKQYVGSFGTHEEATEALDQAKEEYKPEPEPDELHEHRKGVTKSATKKNWEVRVRVDGERRYIGSYPTEAKAIAAQEQYEQQINAKRSPPKKESPQRQEASKANEPTKSKPGPPPSFSSVNEERPQPRKPPRDRSRPPPRRKKLEQPKSAKKRPIKAKPSSVKRKRYSDIKGITQRNDNGKWEVRYYHNGQRKYAGRYSSRVEAIEALRETRLKYKIEEKIGLPEESADEQEQDASESGEKENESADEGSEKDEADLGAEEEQNSDVDAEEEEQEQDDVASNESKNVGKEKDTDAWPFVDSDEENIEDEGANEETSKAAGNTDQVRENEKHENAEAMQTDSPSPRRHPRDSSTPVSSSKKSKPRKSPTKQKRTTPKHIGYVKGLSQRRDNGKWEVRYHHDGKRKYAGRFDTKADAVRCLREVQQEFHIQDIDGLEEVESQLEKGEADLSEGANNEEATEGSDNDVADDASAHEI